MGSLLEHFGIAASVEAEQATRPWNRDPHDRPSLIQPLHR
jgi:hypothetical protein